MHLVHQQIEAEDVAAARAPVGERDARATSNSRSRSAARRRSPSPACRALPAVARTRMPPSLVGRHHEKPVDRTVRLGAEIDLEAVGVDVVGLVVEPERRGVVGSRTITSAFTTSTPR